MRHIKLGILSVLLCFGLVGGGFDTAAASMALDLMAQATFDQTFTPDGVSVTVTAADETAKRQLEGAYLIVAMYDEQNAYLNSFSGRIQFSDNLTYMTEPKPVSQGTKLKYMIWDSMDLITPMVKAAEHLVIPAEATIKRIKGQVVENRVTTLSGNVVINTAEAETVKIKVTGNGGNSGFPVNQDLKVLVGDTRAGEYIGRMVEADVLPSANGTFELVRIWEDTAVSRTIEFEPSQFEALDNSGENAVISYRDSDGGLREFPIRHDNVILYNGICDGKKLNQIFGDLGIIIKDSCQSGRIQAVDVSGDGIYDILFVEIEAYGMVSELKEDGTLVFKNDVGSRQTSNFVREIPFGASGSNCIIRLTKDGKDYDYRNLKPNDCLAIITNNQNPADRAYIEAELVDDIQTGRIVERWDSDTSATGQRYVIETENGRISCDLAEMAFYTGAPRPRHYGTYYLNQYGQLVAALIGAKQQVQYQYIVNASVEQDSWGGNNVTFALLQEDGKVYQYENADTITIENGYSIPVLREKFQLDEYYYPEVFKPNNFDLQEAEEIVRALVGSLVRVELKDHLVKTIELPMSLDFSEGAHEFVFWGSSKEPVEYKENVATLGRYDLADSTKVFFITGENPVFTGEAAVPERCTVGGLNGLKDGESYSCAVYGLDDETGIADAAVIYNLDTGTHDNAGSVPASPVETLSQSPVYIADADSTEDADLLNLMIPYLKNQINELAGTVVIHNAGSVPALAELLSPGAEGNATYIRANYTPEQRTAVMTAMLGQAALCTTDDSGRVTEITLAAANGSHTALDLLEAGTAGYSEETNLIGSHPITDDTVVFFMGGENKIQLYEKATLYNSYSVTGETLTEADEYSFASYDSNGDGTIDILAVFNQMPRVKKNAPIITAAETGTALVDGEAVYAIQFWRDGAFVTAYAAPDAEMSGPWRKGEAYRLGWMKDRIVVSRPAEDR